MKVPALSAVALSLSLCTFAAAPARAQDAAPPPPAAPAPAVGGPPAPGAFGSQGQLVINTDIPLHQTEPSLFLVHESASMGGGSSTTFGIVPSLDYFLAPNVSVGGIVGIQRESASADGLGGTGTVTGIIVGARVGYNVVLTDAFSLWPRLSLSYEHLSFSGSGVSASGYVIPLSIFVPVLWHPAQHFFVGLGPVFATNLISKVEGNDASKTTDIGIQATLGGYFNI